MLRRTCRLSAAKKPIGSRRFLLGGLVAMGVLAPWPALTIEPPRLWTVDQLVAQALQQSALTAAVEGEVAAEEGRAQVAAARPNPQLAYMREQTFGSQGTGEDYLSIGQTLDLSGRRSLLGTAGAVRARAARAFGEGVRQQLAADTRVRFYEVIYRRQRTAALQQWLGRLDQALDGLAKRERRGDAPAYERLRLEREKALAEAQLRGDEAAGEKALARLRAALGKADLDVTGELLPAEGPGDLAALAPLTATRPEVVSLELRAEAAARETQALARWRIPDVRLEGGWKGISANQTGRTDGFLLGASLLIPLWDQAAGQQKQAAGEERALRARRELLQVELRANLVAAWVEAQRSRETAVQFATRVAQLSAQLLRIAQSGFAAGELSLLEFLDAQRGAAQDALTLADLCHAARLARIDLDRQSGGTK